MRTREKAARTIRPIKPIDFIPAALIALVLAAGLGATNPAFAGQATDCPMVKLGNPGGNVCTAADVAIAAAIVGPDSAGAFCFPGDQFVVDIEADLVVRNQGRWDIGVWIAQDGKPLNVSAAGGGAAFCEVVPLPPTDAFSDNWEAGDPPSISSFDTNPNATPASQDQCGDTNGIQNNDPVSGVLLTFGADPSAFNGPITLSCVAGPNGGVVLQSLVSWNQSDPGICDPTDTDTYDLTQTSKCSVNTGEIAVDVVGRVTIVKSAPGGVGQNFDFAWTNDSPPTDPDLNPAQNPFTLQDGQSDEIYAVIGTDGTATVTVTEQNLPFGWQLASIQCSGDDTTPVVIDGNEVTVTLSYNDADPANSQADVTCTFNNASSAPELTLDKTSPTASYDDADDVISYSYVVSNTGNLALAFPVTVSDDRATVTCPADDGGEPNNGDALLDPGESVTCSATYDVSQADIDFGSVTNTATASAGGTQSNQDSVTVNAVQNPLLTVVKSSPTASVSAPGPVSYSYLVTNTGNLTLTGIALSDDNDNDDLSCPASQLAPGANMTCTATHTVTQGEIDANGSPVADSGNLTNTVTAASNEAPDAQDTLNIPIAQDPSLNVVKTGTWNDDGATDDIAEVGETISYTIAVTNDGNTTLTNVAVTDPLITEAPNNGTISCPGGNPIPSLAPTASVNCTATYTLVLADVNAGSRSNTATASDGQTQDDDTEVVNLPVTLGLSLVKTGSFNDDISADGFAEAGETIAYTFDVTNNSSVTVNNVSVSDPLIGAVDCTPESNPIDDLAPDETVQCTGTYTLTQADIDSGQVDNIATADSDETDETTDEESVVLNQNIAWTINKSGEFQDDVSDDGIAQVGETILYTFTIENTGFVTLTNLAVTDAKVPAIDCTPESNPIADIAPGETVQCTGSYTLVDADIDAGQVTNTGTGDPDQTPPENDDEITPLPQASGMSIVKSSATTQVSAPGIVLYTYLVTNTGSSTLTGVALGDDNIDAAVSCPSTSLAVGADMTCTAAHTVTQDEIDANGSPIADSGLLENTVTGTANELGESVTDDLDIPILQSPAMTVQKNSPTSQVTGEGPVTYNYLVTNTGNVTLTGISLIDDNVDGAVDCGGVTELAPGDDVLCSAVHTVTEQELEDNGSPVPDSGELFNQVTASSNESADATDELSIPLNNLGFTTFRVTKDFTDDNEASVEVRLTCNTGLPLVQKFTISEEQLVIFVVELFEPGTMDCRVEEITAGTTGYTTTYLAGAITGDADDIRSEAEGCFFDLVQGGEFTCELTNTLDPVDIVVTKEWVGDVDQIEAAVGLHASAQYSCFDVLDAPDGAPGTRQGSLYFLGNSSDSITGLYPWWNGSPYCVISEIGFASGVEADDSDCQSVPIAPGMGGSCIITNTMFFEGIPTLSQYGLALLALLMLGVGAIGFRRYA